MKLKHFPLFTTKLITMIALCLHLQGTAQGSGPSVDIASILPLVADQLRMGLALYTRLSQQHCDTPLSPCCRMSFDNYRRCPIQPQQNFCSETIFLCVENQSVSRSNSPEQLSDSGHQGPQISQKTAKAGWTHSAQNGEPERGEAVTIMVSAGIQAPEPNIPAIQQASSSGQSTLLVIVSS